MNGTNSNPRQHLLCLVGMKENRKDGKIERKRKSGGKKRNVISFHFVWYKEG